MTILFVTDDADVAAMSTVTLHATTCHYMPLHATTCHWQQKGRCYGVLTGPSSLRLVSRMRIAMNIVKYKTVN